MLGFHLERIPRLFRRAALKAEGRWDLAVMDHGSVCGHVGLVLQRILLFRSQNSKSLARPSFLKFRLAAERG